MTLSFILAIVFFALSVILAIVAWRLTVKNKATLAAIFESDGEKNSLISELKKLYEKASLGLDNLNEDLKKAKEEAKKWYDLLLSERTDKESFEQQLHEAQSLYNNCQTNVDDLTNRLQDVMNENLQLKAQLAMFLKDCNTDDDSGVEYKNTEDAPYAPEPSPEVPCNPDTDPSCNPNTGTKPEVKAAAKTTKSNKKKHRK